jgi:hypothetical protein
VFVVVYRLGLLVFSPEKAAVTEVERAAKGWRGKQENQNRGKAVFLRFLDPIFFSFRPWNAPLFIAGGRGTFCLWWCQILAFGLVGKHPNRWFKVCTSNCQIWQSKAARVGYFRPVIGAVVMLIGLNGRYTVIEGVQVTILVHELSILVDVWGIKCTLKVAPWAVIFGQTSGKTMNSD